MITIENMGSEDPNRMTVAECLYEWEVNGKTFEVNDGKITFTHDAEN